MFYYKVLDNNDNLIDIVNSYDLRYWHKGRIFSCLEPQAQYIYAANKLYRVGWLNVESPEVAGRYPLAQMAICTKEEYEKYKEEQFVAESVQK